ncbi:hypothetical protein Q31a_40620 [Aureliella helgolandensis]|uniref:Uncharacterized protein n=1 Tax=Aureliella helgolandensis TaxID=2527968 RepID=A0A518GAV3_9BACT|nr:hypothetical protein Q31a_40620 [Aureliella helgolandensis]
MDAGALRLNASSFCRSLTNLAKCGSLYFVSAVHRETSAMQPLFLESAEQALV